MAGKKAAGENTKKASGNAKKAEAAALKASQENAKKAAEEDQEWGKGAKNTAKKYISLLILSKSSYSKYLELLLLMFLEVWRGRITPQRNTQQPTSYHILLTFIAFQGGRSSKES